MSRLLNHFRPRFSVRTLAVFVTLVCVYFGAWEATKRYGAEPPHQVLSLPLFAADNYEPHFESPETSPAPFIVCRREPLWASDYLSLEDKCCYYLWLFGPKIKLPFDSE